MLDNQILEVLFPLIEDGVNNMLVSMGYAGNALCQASYQPTREGVTSVPSIYIFKVAPDAPYGMPTYQNVYNRKNNIRSFYSKIYFHLSIFCPCFAKRI